MMIVCRVRMAVCGLGGGLGIECGMEVQILSNLYVQDIIVPRNWRQQKSSDYRILSNGVSQILFPFTSANKKKS